MNFYQNPPVYAEYTQKLFQLKNQYPWLKLFTIGKSVLGRRIYALGIGNLRSLNLFVGAVHAQEWLTTSLLVRFAEDVCQSIQRKTAFAGIAFDRVLLEKGMVLIPMLNPDGVEIALGGIKTAKQWQKKVKEMSKLDSRSWQANVRGVDLNHNFDAGFALCKQAEQEKGITQPSPRQYGGKTPHSEPETKALVHFCESFDVKCAFAFHSQGEEIYFAYGDRTPAVSKYIASLLASYSGYSIKQPTGLASHGGFKDWFVEKQGRPGFTIEIGRGENPLPIEDLSAVYEKLRDAMAVMSVV
jgi:g-D-glutamyl-meso-diaminopimelate peptidase